METEEYRISFFKPTTQQAKKNRTLIVQLFIIWAVAIFGFQILLKILEKPVPEEALIVFSHAWERIETGEATSPDYQAAARSMLQVMGKTTIEPNEYDALKDGVGWALSELYPDAELADIQADVRNLFRLREQITTLQDERYLEIKEVIISKAAPVLGIGENTLLAQILPVGLDEDLPVLSEENRIRIPAIMSLYLIHNRSVLTDTIFLGFPFHYFYTSVFLLVFFIGLCWVYCYRTDRLHARLNFLEQID